MIYPSGDLFIVNCGRPNVRSRAGSAKGDSPHMDLTSILELAHSLLASFADLVPAEALGALEALRGGGPPM
jgi:hypothetical protein